MKQLTEAADRRNLASVLRRLLLLASLVATALVFAVAAAAATVYAGPKTWLPGYSAEHVYNVYFHLTNDFENRSVVSWGRVAYILQSGTWTCSLTTYATITGCGDSDTRTRKPFCKNNDTQTYTGQCSLRSF